MYMPERDIMRLRNKQIVGTIIFVLLGATSFWGTQGPTTQPQQNQQRIQATPIPSDIDPSDPALPVWAKPATSPPSAANTSQPATSGNAPSTKQQPGQQQPGQQPSAGSELGAVTRSGGQYVFRAQVNEVILPVIVTDTRRHIVTNLQQNNFQVYEDGQP